MLVLCQRLKIDIGARVMSVSRGRAGDLQAGQCCGVDRLIDFERREVTGDNGPRAGFVAGVLRNWLI